MWLEVWQTLIKPWRNSVYHNINPRGKSWSSCLSQCFSCTETGLREDNNARATSRFSFSKTMMTLTDNVGTQTMETLQMGSVEWKITLVWIVGALQWLLCGTATYHEFTHTSLTSPSHVKAVKTIAFFHISNYSEVIYKDKQTLRRIIY